MIRKTEYLCVFLTGGVIYGCLELLWRGYTHWSMTIAGGICLLLLHLINRKLGAWHLLARCLMGCFLITLVEFVIGIVVNRILGLGVWDYSAMPGNVLGQICPAFTVMWFFISLPAFVLSGAVSRFFQWMEKREEYGTFAGETESTGF
ncbi:MAG: hypothetical protein IJC71_06515 [Clostridia bacterium]|nr:hypothetical protein [Clostridia bacterium]